MFRPVSHKYVRKLSYNFIFTVRWDLLLQPAGSYSLHISTSPCCVVYQHCCDVYWVGMHLLEQANNNEHNMGKHAQKMHQGIGIENLKWTILTNRNTYWVDKKNHGPQEPHKLALTTCRLFLPFVMMRWSSNGLAVVATAPAGGQRVALMTVDLPKLPQCVCGP